MTQPNTSIAGGDDLDQMPEDTVARLVVEKQLATRDDIDTCYMLQQQREAEGETRPSMIQLLVDNGFATRLQLSRLSHQHAQGRPDQQIPGFQLLEVVGEGANAKVYKARQISLDRVVALKILPRSATSNEEFVQRFYEEGRAAGKLNHPNVVGALDVDKAGDYHYFAMEFIEGRNVFEVLSERNRIPEDEATQIAMEVARGLEHAHKAGMIHRDVKPQNIIITKQGISKLTDLGLARAVSDAAAAEQEKGKAFGTPYYISPEQIRGRQDIDYRADIYSLGATLYYMLTGKVPFDAETAKEVMIKHLKQALPEPEKENKFLSKGICAVIKVCMAKDPDDRYDTTTQLVQDLEAMVNDEPPLHAQTKLGLDLKTESGKEEKQRQSAQQLLRSTMIQKQEAEKALKKAELMVYVGVAGWLFAFVFLFMWLMNQLMGGPES